MLLIDSNIFIYARGDHPHSPDCRTLISESGNHPEWKVSFLVLLELTHYYGDGGAYAVHIADAFSVVETEVGDFTRAIERASEHSELNDYTLLCTAHRRGCRGIVSYDEIFSRQTSFPEIGRVEPGELIE